MKQLTVDESTIVEDLVDVALLATRWHQDAINHVDENVAHPQVKGHRTSSVHRHHLIPKSPISRIN